MRLTICLLHCLLYLTILAKTAAVWSKWDSYRVMLPEDDFTILEQGECIENDTILELGYNSKLQKNQSVVFRFRDIRPIPDDQYVSNVGLCLTSASKWSGSITLDIFGNAKQPPNMNGCYEDHTNYTGNRLSRPRFKNSGGPARPGRYFCYSFKLSAFLPYLDTSYVKDTGRLDVIIRPIDVNPPGGNIAVCSYELSQVDPGCKVNGQAMFYIIRRERYIWGSWSDSTICESTASNCTEGTCIRSRDSTRQSNENHLPLVNGTQTEETSRHECDYSWSLWSAWSNCDTTAICGFGDRERSRENQRVSLDTNLPMFNGTEKESQACNKPCVASSPFKQCSTNINLRGIVIVDHTVASTMVRSLIECCNLCTIMRDECRSVTYKKLSPTPHLCQINNITIEESQCKRDYIKDDDYWHYSVSP